MTLRARLALGIFTIGCLLLLPLVLAYNSLRQIGEGAQELRAREFGASTLLGRLRSASEDFADAELQLGVDTNPALVYPQVTGALDRLQLLANSLEDLGFGRERPIIDTATAQLRGLAERELAALLSRRTPLADDISADSIPPVLSRVEKSLRRMEGEVELRTGERVTEVTGFVADARDGMALAFAVAAVLALLVAGLLTWSIGRPVRALEEGMARVADGEFDTPLRIGGGRNDEFGRLATSFAQMTQQLAELDKLKAEFVSVASHELKTPINVILGYVQLLQEDVYGPMTPRQREVLGTIENQGHTLTRLVRQLLDISRFEAGVGRIEPRPFALLDFVQELERAFDVLARQRDVQFKVRRTDDVPDQVTWDYDRMNEVLGNLLSNAFKFTGRGGRVELVVDTQAERVQIEVKDTGAGIAPEQLPRIFEKFYQADNQSAAAAKGTGLGLAIAKSIVEAHGGTITCESTPGVGTTFTIDLPVRVSTRRGGLTPRMQSPIQAGTT